MEADTTLYLQLHKLSGIKSEEELDDILSTLWRTRRTGLSSPEKSHIQSLLNLPSPSEVDPVSACLRSLIRKCVNENFTGDNLLKLFPPDLPLELQSILILLLQKYQNQWKQDSSKEQHPLPRSSVPYQTRTNTPPSFSSSSEMSMWPHQDDNITRFNRNYIGTSTPITDSSTMPPLAPLSLQPETAPDNIGVLPRLKSMTWTMENSTSAPANRVAIISLKLQDYTKSPLGETEVKFQLTRDTLEALLRSMAYISQQLSITVGSSSGPAQKKPRQ